MGLQSDSLQLEGRVAIVTGASRGIGRAVAERFAALGARVVVNFVNDARAADEVVQLVRAKGSDAIAVRADVSKLADAEALVNECIAKFGRLDILVCNAGIWDGAPIENMSEGLWDRTLDVNLKGTWTVCHAAVPHMKAQQYGRIVIVSSTAGQRGEANYSNYAASKGGQISFTKALATELAGYGINVNAIAPGWVDTEMSSEAIADEGSGAIIKATIPLGRVATADEIAGPIVFLCSNWASFITGEVLNVNGGAVLCG